VVAVCPGSSVLHTDERQATATARKANLSRVGGRDQTAADTNQCKPPSGSVEGSLMLPVFGSERLGRSDGRTAAGVLVSGIVANALLLGMSVDTRAHSGGTSNADGHGAKGLEIPAITHSDMTFVAPHYSAIVRLAEKQKDTDERLRRLLNHTKLQRVYCLWGLVPGAVTDEESIFNPCSHAYLASGLALLRHLGSRPASREEAAHVNHLMEAERTAAPVLVLCQSSAETFDTAQIIAPITRTAAVGWFSVLTLATVITRRVYRSVTHRSGRDAPE